MDFYELEQEALGMSPARIESPKKVVRNESVSSLAKARLKMRRNSPGGGSGLITMSAVTPPQVAMMA